MERRPLCTANGERRQLAAAESILLSSFMATEKGKKVNSWVLELLGEKKSNFIMFRLGAGGEGDKLFLQMSVTIVSCFSSTSSMIHSRWQCLTSSLAGARRRALHQLMCPLQHSFCVALVQSHGLLSLYPGHVTGYHADSPKE